jgi:c(7)-type cytochrome triheme protein
MLSDDAGAAVSFKTAEAVSGSNQEEIRMRIIVILTALLVTLNLAGLAQQKAAPGKLVFQTKMGNVTYDHAKHLVRAKNDCTACHTKLWPQDAKAPLNFKAGMHKIAERGKTSCATCHVAGGTAFVTTGNCAKCHVKATQ